MSALARIDPSVPYDLLDQALVKARQQFPTAHAIRPLWTPGGEHEVICEVQEEARGRAFTWTP